VFYRRLSQFFKEHYPEIKLASELEKELAIRSLINSGNFASTHSAIDKLKKYAEFYKSILNNHGKEIEEEFKKKLKVELNMIDPEEENV